MTQGTDFNSHWTRWRWFWTGVVLPFAITRLVLVLIGYFAQIFPAYNEYPIPDAPTKGWIYTHYLPLDFWGRWDTDWYDSIVTHGYQERTDLREFQSNIAFFPVYPTLVRVATFWRLEIGAHPNEYLFGAVLVANLAALLALALLYRLALRLGMGERGAERAVLFLLLFPTGFFLSAAYSESTYLLMAIASFWFALDRRWALAGLTGVLLALSRPPGVIIALPLAWLYMDERGWDWHRIRLDALWLGLPALGLLLFLIYGWQLTGDFFAPLHVQSAWGKSFEWPWTTFFHPLNEKPGVTQVDRAALVFCLGLAIYSLRKLPSKAYGIYALLVVLPPLFSGQMTSMARYCLAAFPVFLVLAQIENRWVERGVMILFFAVQIVLWVAWVRFYFIG